MIQILNNFSEHNLLLQQNDCKTTNAPKERKDEKIASYNIIKSRPKAGDLPAELNLLH